MAYEDEMREDVHEKLLYVKRISLDICQWGEVELKKARYGCD